MIILQDASLKCPSAGCMGFYEWIRVDGCYRCYICGLEDYGPGHNKPTLYEAREVYRLHLKYVDSIRKHGGGSKQAGRKRAAKHKIFRPRYVTDDE